MQMYLGKSGIGLILNRSILNGDIFLLIPFKLDEIIADAHKFVGRIA